MTNVNWQDVKSITYGGRTIEVTQDLDAQSIVSVLNIPTNSEPLLNPITGELRYEAQVGTKGCDDEYEDTSEQNDDHVEYQETQGPVWALPKHTFNHSEVVYVESKDVNVENMQELVAAVTEYRELVNEHAKQFAQEFVNGQYDVKELLVKFKGLDLL